MEYQNVTGRIYDIQGYAVHDGPGIRTTVYTKGCPLRCLWCHSPESQYHSLELGYLPVKCLGVDLCQNACVSACPNGAISAGEPVRALDGSGELRKAMIDRAKCTGCLKCTKACITKALYPSGRDTTVDEVYERLDKDRGFFKNGGGITISGGEAMAQFEFTLNLAKRLKDSGLHICLDTTGFAPTEEFKQILPYIDLFLYDIKHMDTLMHKKLTGVGNELILTNARFLAEHGGALQIRVPVIPKLTDKEDNLRATAAFCAELGEAVKLVQLLPYHATGRMKYDRLGWHYKLKNVEPPTEDFMNRILALFQSYGLSAQLY
ncbi:pyruvate formate lyase activating enzyme [Sporobacter termitidis DSM 10068]|uniref:Pyruvate formate lyase activating enzyme n=1 Tax=Sporobacter termitidis DSM 10068 TaxID=1123282 RepID=A0A1M5Z3C6_9FIRM|nr:glycyl-radical enzyme activating protein [Sporobacter termitidis]SHI18755.1 pyruvate formate lyase activating enzyme [Sporobacter termitidis DSM 10068]